jgi:hypothetical protein
MRPAAASKQRVTDAAAACMPQEHSYCPCPCFNPEELRRRTPECATQQLHTNP